MALGVQVDNRIQGCGKHMQTAPRNTYISQRRAIDPEGIVSEINHRADVGVEINTGPCPDIPTIIQVPPRVPDRSHETRARAECESWRFLRDHAARCCQSYTRCYCETFEKPVLHEVIPPKGCVHRLRRCNERSKV